MALVGVFEQVAEHRSDIVSLSNFLKDEYLIEEAAQSRYYHLQLDRNSDLTLKSSIGQILLVRVLVIVDNADQ